MNDTQYYGYAGKILFVDLGTGKSETRPLDMEMATSFIGGCGVGLRLLYDLLKPGIDPLSPDNPVIIGAGPLVGTPVPASNKIQLVTKFATPANPEQTRYYVGIASGGSHRFGLMMKNAGFDQIVITGRAAKPVYLRIANDDVEICSAEALWGNRDAHQTSDDLASRHKRSGVIAISRAGENLVTFSLPFVDGRGTIGRGGAAAVMGAKNLKAIAVYGDRGVSVADPMRLMTLADGARKKESQLPYFSKPSVSRWQLSSKWMSNYPPEMWEDTRCGLWSDASCGITCKSLHRIKDGEFAGDTWATSIFMTAAIYGRRLELTDYREAIELFSVANRLGIDFATMVGMIRFVTRLYERGEITSKETGGLELKMGDVHSYLKLADSMADREGIGETMAQGWYALSKRLGVDANTDWDGDGIVKGTTTLYDARFTSMEPTRFECIVNPKGGMHNHPITYYPNQSMSAIREFCLDLAMPQEAIDRIVGASDFDCGRFERHIEDGEAVYFSLGVCAKHVMWRVLSVKLLADFYSAVTGIETSPEQLKKAGERVWNLYKLLNVREGFNRADDTCPGVWARTIEEPIKTAAGEICLKDYFGRALTRQDIEKMLDNYYDERGWDIARGVPAPKKLAELGLDKLADKDET